jgi:hypothetical protein
VLLIRALRVGHAVERNRVLQRPVHQAQDPDRAVPDRLPVGAEHRRPALYRVVEVDPFLIRLDDALELARRVERRHRRRRGVAEEPAAREPRQRLVRGQADMEVDAGAARAVDEDALEVDRPGGEVDDLDPGVDRRPGALDPHQRVDQDGGRQTLWRRFRSDAGRQRDRDAHAQGGGTENRCNLPHA